MGGKALKLKADRCKKKENYSVFGDSKMELKSSKGEYYIKPSRHLLSPLKDCVLGIIAN